MSTRRSDEAAEAFRARIREAPAKPERIAAYLDGLGPEERVDAIRGVGRADQRRLFEAVEGHAAVALADLVPPATPEGGTVRHFGKNTLPLFTHFEKRFSRPPGHDPSAPGELWGYNHQSLSPLTGPGYFVAKEDAARGEVWIDYREVPPEAPRGWPPVRTNERGVGRLVYGSMVDSLRRVSEHVTIGSAAAHGRELGSWFLLCREP